MGSYMRKRTRSRGRRKIPVRTVAAVMEAEQTHRAAVASLDATGRRRRTVLTWALVAMAALVYVAALAEAAP